MNAKQEAEKELCVMPDCAMEQINYLKQELEATRRKLAEANRVVKFAKILLNAKVRDDMTLQQNLNLDKKYRTKYHKALSDYEASKE